MLWARTDCPTGKVPVEKGIRPYSTLCVRPFLGIWGRSCRAGAGPLLFHSSESGWEVMATTSCSFCGLVTS